MSHIEILTQDIRYGIRSIRRKPGLAIATVLTLTLGLGLNVSVFTILQGLLFRARVAKDPASFVHLSPEYKSSAPLLHREIPWAISVRDYQAYANQTQSLDSLGGWSVVHATLGIGDRDPVLSLLVTCNFFDVYGLDSPRMGRTFSPAECSAARSAAPVVVISEEVWKTRFASDPEVIGKTVRINRTHFTIVGVLPAGFAGCIRGPGIWIPWTMQPLFFPGNDFFRSDSARWLTVEGRLKPGVTQAAARSELSTIAAQLDRLEPGRETTMILTNGSFAEEPALRGNLFWIGPVVMGALTLVLLIACTNVTVLQLSRAVGRQREMGIRLSIGAGRIRLVRMLLTEILLLASIAGSLSVYIAYVAPAIFVRYLAPPGMPIYQTKPDLAVLIYLGIIVFVATCMAGLSPAAESLRINLFSSMKTGDAGAAAGTSGRRGFLVAAQVAMSLVLLVSSGLFIRAQSTMFSADPGYETHHVLSLPLQLDQSGQVRFTTLMNRLREIPGIDSVAAGSPPGAGELGSETEEIRLPGELRGAGKQAAISEASTDYFDTLRIPLLRGHAPANKGEAVISKAFGQAFWPGRDPLGQRAILSDEAMVTVVAIAGNLQAEHPGTADGPHLYRWRDIAVTADSLLVRFSDDERSVSARIRDTVKQLDPEADVTPRTLRSMIDETAGRLTLIVRMIGTLAGLALALSVLGIYGVVAFTVTQRTKEIGIRMALGATKALIIRVVLESGARPVAWGIGVGAVLAIAGAQAVAVVLRHAPVPIQPRDPLVYLAVAALLALIAIAAMFKPALRASSVDPIQALRDE